MGGKFGRFDLVVEYRCDGPAGMLVHHQVFEHGVLESWTQGPATSPDLVLHQPMWANEAMLSRCGEAEALVRSTHVVEAAGDQVPPPLDEVVVPWGAELPVVVSAGSLLVQQVLGGSPFGTVSIWARLEQGRVVAAGLGDDGPPDVMVWRDYGAALRERAGVLDVAESLLGGDIQGDVGKLAVFMGLYDSDECAEARRALTRPSWAPLAELGRLLSSAEWAGIAARFDAPTSTGAGNVG